MPVEALSSNVVNYLVWRYLQEAGFGNAALQLSRVWNRDPDSLPFASNVQPHTLIHLLQDGLWFDKLQAEATNGQQRYHFGPEHGRPFSVRNGELLTLDQGIPAYQLAEEVNGSAEPPPKKGTKKRKAAKPNGVIAPPPEAQINGDAMDVDQNGHTHVTNSVRAESEIVASDVDSPSVAELPISTLSIGHDAGIQTEQPSDLASNTVFVGSVRDPDKLVNLVKWGGPGAPLLLTAGKSLFRLHFVPTDATKDSKWNSDPFNIDLPLHNYSITALCWSSRDEIYISAREERTNEQGEVMKSDKLLRVVDGGSEAQVVSSSAGLVSTLQYNNPSQLLLAISSDGSKGSIKIWKDNEDSVDIQLPLWTDFTETTIYDAAWLGESAFAVCGQQLFSIYDIGESLSCRHKLETDITWEILKCDPSTGIIVGLGIKEQQSYLGILHPSDPAKLRTLEYPDEYFTDLDLRRTPIGAENPASPRSTISASPLWLATCATSGVIRVWDANNPFEGLKILSMADQTMANSVAFSPDGRLLAAAGPDAVTVWELEKREEPIAIWRAEGFSRDEWDPSLDGQISLEWDHNSARLSISIGNQIAVIPV